MIEQKFFVGPHVGDSTAEYSVRFEGHDYPVRSLREASEKWVTFRDITCAGASELPIAYVVDRTGNLIGYIAYNGRIFAGHPAQWRTESRILYDNWS